MNEMNSDEPIADDHHAPVPRGRLARLARLGGLAGGIAGGMLAEGARQFARGERPRLGGMLLTPANARRVTDELARLRGAAMKVGQLLSMDAGDLLTPELADILARLREGAAPMPMSQLVTVLEEQWGAGWDARFAQFSFAPAAAASIGQVHFARTRAGHAVALKIQYPGVRESIDSDVDNVARVLRMTGLFPARMSIDALLDEAKQQLHAEADYRQEGMWLKRYAALLADDAHFVLPAVHDDLTTDSILAMSRVGGVPIESLGDAPQAERDLIVTQLFELLFREIFEFRLIQTDPNFANYRYDTSTQQLILLDFGATRAYPHAIVAAYRQLMTGAIAQQRDAMTAAARQIGYFAEQIADDHRDAVLRLFTLACEPLRHAGAYDFGHTDLARRVHDAGMALTGERDFWHTPPADAVFLHRKTAGLFLLAARLRARVDVGRLAMRWLEDPAPHAFMR